MIDIWVAVLLCVLSFLAGGVFYAAAVGVAIHRQYDPNWQPKRLKWLFEQPPASNANPTQNAVE